MRISARGMCGTRWRIRDERPSYWATTPHIQSGMDCRRRWGGTENIGWLHLLRSSILRRQRLSILVMRKLFRQLNSLFNRRERWQLAILSVALVIRAAVEMVGVASIMPFMSVVAEPEMVQTNPYLNAVYEALGFTSVTGFITALGVAVVVFLVLANGFSALAVYGMTRFSWGMHHRLAMRLLTGYLRMPYGFFVR